VVAGIEKAPDQPVIGVKAQEAGFGVKLFLVPVLVDHALFLVENGVVFDEGLGE
jgi:hypothetical protein